MEELSEYEIETLRAAAVHQPDWFLRHLVSMANDGDISVPVTLTVGGSLVAGHIISGREYFRTLGQQFSAALGMSEEKGAELFQPFIDAYYTREAKREPGVEQAYGTGEAEQGARNPDEESEFPSPPSYIHLKNARVYHGTTQIPQRFEGTLWRGRLGTVSGFVVGEVRQERA